MIETKDISRPHPEICKALAAIGTASVTGALNNLGLRNSFIMRADGGVRGSSLERLAAAG